MALDLHRQFQRGLAGLLAAVMIGPAEAKAAAPQSGLPAPARTRGDLPSSADPRNPPYYLILKAPDDLDALLQKIQRPDLELRPVDGTKPADGAAATRPAAGSVPWVVESVRIRGSVRGEVAALKVELAIVTDAEDLTWVPIRLDGQRLIDAREGARILDLRMMNGGRWQVGLSGRGSHRIEVDLRSPLITRPARASVALAIPEAPSTALELDFDRRQTDLIIGTDEAYGQSDLPDGKGARLSARLAPRSRVEVSWAVDAATGERNPPVLSAQGDIAIDIDSEQMWTRSSWVIRCVRGMTKTLEVRVDDQDEVTEVRVDDQEAGGGIEGGPGAGRLTIPLPEPLRPGPAERRLVLKTRRPFKRPAGHRIQFGGFPITYAREQTGAIGVIQSPNLWVAPASSQGLRRIVPTFLPKELAERPGTSLAFEFLDQPFSLGLDVEASPPLIGSRSSTRFRLEGDRARSEAKIEFQWVRGRPFEVDLALGPGLEVVAVGPPPVVEAWNLTKGEDPRGTPGGSGGRGLTIRLSPTVRDLSRVTLELEGSQRLPREGPVRLGLFAPGQATAVSASFSVVVDRGLGADLDEQAARVDGADGSAFRTIDLPVSRATGPSGGDQGGRVLNLQASGGPKYLPLRITRHARTIRQDTIVVAEVSRESIDVLQKTTFAVRHGTLDAPTIRVPGGIAGRWELRGRTAVDRDDLGGDPDGSRRYRLYLDRPVQDGTTLEFRWRSPLDRALDAGADRELEVPWIGFPEAAEGATRVELSPRPGVVLRASDPSWARAPEPGATGAADEPTGSAFVPGPGGAGPSFRFRVGALQPVAMPGLLVSRLLVRSSFGPDDTVQHRAWYWVETHGPVFAFELPEGARILAARVGGRDAERVELESHGVSSARYRLAIPADATSRPIPIDLEYQLPEASDGSGWSAPRLPDDGVVLETLWEVRLPWDRALLGVPRGWSDENEWSWEGNHWLRRPAGDAAALVRWLAGDDAPGSSVEDRRGASPDGSQQLLFGRAAGRPGEPIALAARIVSRAWLVAACSGATLLVGFLAIFTRIRFRTAWAIAAVLALLGASSLQPSVAAQLVQSSLMGAALTCLGILIQNRIDRRRSPSRAGREPSSGMGAARGDSSMNRAPGVGSDEPTAIRVRTPSTMDYIPAPLAGPDAADEARSSTVGRA